MPSGLKSRPLTKWSVRLFSGAAIVLTGAAAEAQLDRDWLDRALQSAQQATSPWPAVEEPQRAPSASESAPKDTQDTDFRQVPSPPPQLDVQAVDTFDDPWEPGPQLSVSTEELIDPWAEDLPPRGSPETLGRGASYEHIDLVDPWE